MIWGNALGKTRTCRILYELPGLTHRYLLFANNLATYQQKVLQANPKHIISIGNYRKSKYPIIHCESTVLSVNGDTIPIPYPAFSHPQLIMSNTIGNGKCNFFTREMVLFIAEQQISTRYSFMHIPQNMSITSAITILTECAGLISHSV